MLKPSLQLKLGQQLTMTPQLQQAIRLLQLPALELQAHIRELLETNVMLEPLEEAEATGTFETVVTAAEQSKPPERTAESSVEVLDEGWGDHSVGPAETPWSCDDDERQQEYADASGQSLQDHLLWQLELASLSYRELAIARAIVDAVSDDGYLTESLEEIARRCARSSNARRRKWRACSPACRRSIRPASRRARSANASSCSCGSSSRPRPASRWRSRSPAATSVSSPSASCRCCVASCAPPKTRSPRHSAWCGRATRARAPPSAPAVRNTWCRTCSCAAPSRAGAWRSTPRRCRACASIKATPASSAVTPATPACARSCRRRAGC